MDGLVGESGKMVLLHKLLPRICPRSGEPREASRRKFPQNRIAVDVIAAGLQVEGVHR